MENQTEQWWWNLSGSFLSCLRMNENPFGLCDSKTRRVLRDALAGNSQDFEVYSGDSWKEVRSMSLIQNDMAYRLKQDWMKPVQKPKPGPEWEICEVTVDPFGCYVYALAIDREPLRKLGSATYRVGFDGVEFEEWPGKWFGQINKWFTESDTSWPSDNPVGAADRRPATPKRVRFRK